MTNIQNLSATSRYKLSTDNQKTAILFYLLDFYIGRLYKLNFTELALLEEAILNIFHDKEGNPIYDVCNSKTEGVLFISLLENPKVYFTLNGKKTAADVITFLHTN